MGTDKAQLVLAQQTLLNRAVALLESVNLEKVFVSGHYPSFACIPDLHQRLGPIGGLHACVDALWERYDALFIMAVDMPLLSEKECRQLLKLYQQQRHGVYFDVFTLPMILPLNQQLKDYLGDAILADKQQRSLYRLLKTLNIQAVNYLAEDSFRFQNSNTPEEWQTSQAAYVQLSTCRTSEKDKKD